jgi:hypothetical protein
MERSGLLHTGNFLEYPIGQTRLFSKRASNAGYGVGLAMSCSVRPGSGRRQPGKRADPLGEGVAEHRLYREQSEGRQVTKRSFRTNLLGATALLGCTTMPALAHAQAARNPMPPQRPILVRTPTISW